MTTQLAFSSIDEGLERHRSRVQALFDGLPLELKRELASLLKQNSWETCSTLCAAAGSWKDEREQSRTIKNAA